MATILSLATAKPRSSPVLRTVAIGASALSVFLRAVRLNVRRRGEVPLRADQIRRLPDERATLPPAAPAWRAIPGSAILAALSWLEQKRYLRWNKSPVVNLSQPSGPKGAQ